jgi:hypothetical protein
VRSPNQRNSHQRSLNQRTVHPRPGRYGSRYIVMMFSGPSLDLPVRDVEVPTRVSIDAPGFHPVTEVVQRA